MPQSSILPYKRAACVGLLGLGLAGCAHYTALPLPERPALASSLADLRHSGGPMPPILGVDEIARLVAENNPDLVATRAQNGVAQAQLLQAGLPPNPSVTGAVLPLAAGVGNTTAYNAGLSYDIKSLITLSARRRSADAGARQVNAQILWQEWQTAGQARLLTVDLIVGERDRRLLTATQDLLTRRLNAAQAALAAGNLTLTAVAPDIAATQAIRTQRTDLARQQLQRRHQLNALLGLSPDVMVPFAEQPDLPPFDRDAVIRDLPTLPRRRPDLVALQLGYRAQDEKVRAAILAQFPNLTVGVTGGSDNSGVRNIGPQITLELPIFDHNQGNIAIERATRQQLHDEYAARLTAADGQVRAMLSEMDLLTGQIAAARRDLAPLRRAGDAAVAAFTAGNLDERGYVDLITARLSKEQEVLGMEQSLLDQRIAVDTLTGVGMPTIELDPP